MKVRVGAEDGSGTGELRIQLWSDVGGSPGALVDPDLDSGIAGFGVVGNGADLILFLPGASLAAGTYWIVIEPGDITGGAGSTGCSLAGQTGGTADQVKLWDGSTWSLSANVENLFIEVLGSTTDADWTRAVEDPAQPDGIVHDLRIRRTVTQGNQEASLVLDNAGARCNAWAPGDSGVVRVQGQDEGSLLTVLDGILGRPVYEPGQGRPTVRFTLWGWNFILDLINTDQALEYQGTSYVDIVKDLRSRYLGADWSNNVDSNSAAPPTWSIPAGMNLRAAFDQLRRALIAATGNEWEFSLSIANGRKQLNFAQRSSAVVGPTVALEDLRPGSHLDGGDLLDVINDARVLGKTTPSKFRDKSTLTRVGAYRLDATTKRLGVPFVADASPMYLVRWKGDRSVTTNPPSVNGYVARNSDNAPRLRQALKGLTATRTPGIVSNASRVNDDSDSSFAGISVTDDDVKREVIAYDLGAGPGRLTAVRLTWDTIVGWDPGEGTLYVESSTDDGTWTTRKQYDVANDGSLNGIVVDITDNDDRYWRLASKFNGAHPSFNGIGEMAVLQGGPNLSTDATDPNHCLRAGDASHSTIVSSTGGGTIKELARFDHNDQHIIAKWEVKHLESIASSLYTLELQHSSNGTDWTTIAILPSSTGTVTDTAYFEGGRYRYWRLITRDDRAGGSASATSTCNVLSNYHQTGSWGNPLIGDKMTGSTVTWDVNGLVQRPGTVEERTYPSPRLSIAPDSLANLKYWFVLEPQSGAGVNSWWEADYGTEAAYLTAAKVSTDSGSTWSQLAANAVPLVRFEFDNRQLVGTSEDAASKIKYASIIPAGKVQSSIVDEALGTQDMVDREASAWTTKKGDVRKRPVLVVPYHGGYEPGKKVRVDRAAVEALGDTVSGSASTKDYDIVEVVDAFPLGGAPTTSLYLNEHPIDPSGVLGEVGSLASQRR